MAESRQLRQNAKDAGPKEEDDAFLDNLLEKLRSGDTVTRRARWGRPKLDTRPIIAPLDKATPFNTTVPLDTVDVARDMLVQLKRDGFGTHLRSLLHHDDGRGERLISVTLTLNLTFCPL
jgi:cytokinesis protein